MTITRQPTNGITRFSELRLPSTPPKVAEGVRAFLEEDISAYNLFDLRAHRRVSDLPDGAKLFKGSDPLAAFNKAAKSHMLRSFLRTVATLQSPVPRWDPLLIDGSEAVYMAAKSSGRSHDVESVIIKANLLVQDALQTKLQAHEHEIMALQIQICASAGLLGSLKALEDVDFPRKAEYTAHAKERWDLINKGFGIYLYDLSVPYIYCVDQGGTSALSDGGSSTHHGPLCAP